MPHWRFLDKGEVNGSGYSVATARWKGGDVSGQGRGLRRLRCHCKGLAVVAADQQP